MRATGTASWTQQLSIVRRRTVRRGGEAPLSKASWGAYSLVSPSSFHVGETFPASITPPKPHYEADGAFAPVLQCALEALLVRKEYKMRIGSAGWLVMGGTLSGVLGCADPLPPPARLAVNLELASCGVDDQYALPEDPLVRTTLQASIPQSQLDALPRMVEAENGASVSCSVVESSPNNFTFSASASVGNTRRFTLNGGVTTGPSGVGKGTGTATVSFLHPNTIPARTGTNCTIETELAPAGGGALLLSFDCSPPTSTFQAESLPGVNCSATGTVVIDRCSK